MVRVVSDPWLKFAQYYNWQFAFLQAFSATFQQPLDVEKWWSLQLLHFTGRGWPRRGRPTKAAETG